ncbi:hypothetical protein BJV77DRAFT_1017679 [Russula vinacea]|nr:hypothetical protein BJV77DRAFT_1017679 [Russula vinacea]
MVTPTSMASSPLEPLTPLSVSDLEDASSVEKLFNFPDADIILRSVDERDFRVLKLFMIQAASNSSASILPANTTPLPVVHLPESAAILCSLLTFVLPMPPVLPPSVEETMELLSVAKNPPLFCKSNALHVYSLAQKYGLRLESTLTIENLEGKLDVVPGDHLHELWKYHQRVQLKLVSNVDGFRGSNAYNALNCLKCVELTSSGIPKWIDGFICSMARTPSSLDLLEFQNALARHLTNFTGPFSLKQCFSCRTLPRQAIDEFWTALTTFVHANMEEAESAFCVSEEDTKDHIGVAAVILALPECLDFSKPDFRIHKAILSSSSQFFRDMFSLPQPSDSETDAELVRALITVLYPIRSQIPTSYERSWRSLRPRRNTTCLFMRKRSPAKTGAQAFRAFAIAFSNNLSPEIQTTARLTLDFPLTFESLGDELRLFRGSALRELVGFRKMCRDNIVTCLESFLDAHNGPSRIWVGCPKPSRPEPQALPSSSAPQGEVVRSFDVGIPAIRVVDNDKTLPPWLHDLFTQQIGELKQYFTSALIKPSNIREKYLAALMKHSPTSSDCPTCLMGYLAELEQKLTRARNQELVIV